VQEIYEQQRVYPRGVRLKAEFLKFIIFAVFLALAGTARAQLVNGNFATGNLAGWSISNTVGSVTPFGLETGGTAVAQVVLFDIAGTGTPVNCAVFQVGQTGGEIGASSPGQGIVLSQYVLLNPGQLTMSLDIAAYSPGNNGDAGTFQLLLDGNVMASDVMGFIGFQNTIRSSLDYAGAIAEGTHQIGIEITRAGGFAPDTPFEYLANFQVSVVPEPSVTLLATVGGCVCLFFRTKLRKSATGRRISK
jgi:hypothetical protein